MNVLFVMGHVQSCLESLNLFTHAAFSFSPPLPPSVCY